jgi:hypothetical protein
MGWTQPKEETKALRTRGRRIALRPVPSGGAATSTSLLGVEQVATVVEHFFGGLRRSVRKNLALLTNAFVTLSAALRSGNGELTLAAVARALPLPTSFKDRYKRLNRFLDNRLFDPQGLTEGLFALLLGLVAAPAAVPVILDQSTVGAAELLLAGIPQAGRVLPLSLLVFTYADIQTQPNRVKSQNFIERLFILRLLEAAPTNLMLCFILDRGYARVSLMLELLAQRRVIFVLRAKRNVVIWRMKRGRWTKSRLGSLRARPGQPRRLERIRYRGRKSVEVDLVIYYERGHKEPWYLVVRPGSTAQLPTSKVVSLYRQRMHVEQGFRDFKTHLGVRGLRLQVRTTQRVQRLLQAFTLAYAFIVSLGMCRVAEEARWRLEKPRLTVRHDTDRILSVRTVAALLLCGLCTELLARLTTTIDRLIRRTLAGRGLYKVAPFL